MARNPLGAVALNDFGSPRIITATAGVNLSGGMLVWFSGTGVVSSGISSFVTADLIAQAQASGAQFNGIVMQDTASGSPVPVAMNGTFIVTTVGTTVAGQKVAPAGSDTVAPLPGSPSCINSIADSCGRCLADNTSGNYCIVDFHG